MSPVPSEQCVSSTCLTVSRCRHLLVLLTAILPATIAAQQRTQLRTPAWVEVTPKGTGTVSVASGGTRSVNFTVYSTYPGTTNYTLECTPSGMISSCSIDEPSITLDEFQSGGVTVEITASVGSGSGDVTLTASGVASDYGWIPVNVIQVVGPTVTQPRQADSLVDYGRCLTAGSGIGAWSCGHQVMTLGTPGLTTLERSRAMTLVYNSATASPRPIVSANVVVGGGSPMLDRVRAVLEVADTVRATATYTGWTGASKQVSIGWSSGNRPTGIYPYELTLWAVSGSDSAATTVTGNLFIVNRANGPMGTGWEWLGVERLVFSQPAGTAHLMWVGGDGSAAHYRQVTSTRWVAPPAEYRDTIVYASGEYTRTLRHGIQVVYDATGRHVRTINRANQVTLFHWASATRLDSVRVPPAGSGGRTIRLAWSGSTLDSVIVSTGKGVNATIDGSGNLIHWGWPDGTYQQFAWDGSNRPSTTEDSRGGITRYVYGAHGLVEEARVYYTKQGSGADSAVTKFTPWQAAGYSGNGGSGITAGDTAQAVTTVFGPRVGIADDAIFHVTKWGSPSESQDARGMITRYGRDDAAVPALVTSVQYPNSRRAMMTYNARGNLLTLTDSTWGSRAFPTLRSSWAYADGNAPDSPSKMKGPAGDSTMYSYTSLGLTSTITDPRGHVTSFAYAASDDSVRGQVRTIAERAVGIWKESSAGEIVDSLTTTLGYDISGNIRRIESPSGAIQRQARDSDGRVTSDTSALGQVRGYVWDAMDRQTHLIRPHAAGATAWTCYTGEFTCADLTVDALNPPNSVDTTIATYTGGMLTKLRDPRGVEKNYRYDLRGLMVADLDEAGAKDSARYDPAGLLIGHKNRLDSVITKAYDLLDRDSVTVVPVRVQTRSSLTSTALADTLRTTYDSVGNVLTKVSRIGTVQRTYYENGALKSERMIPGTPPGMLADSMRFTYDSVGRLQRIAWQNGDSLMYWMRRPGDLDSMRVWWVTDGAQRSEIWKFAWDSLGRRRSIIYPYASMTATWHYDRAGTVRRVLSDNASGVVTNRFKTTFAQDSVDVTGRVIGQYTYCDTNYDPGVTVGMTCQGWLPDRSSNRFNRLGALVIQRKDITTDTLWYDQSGNRTAAKSNTLIQNYTLGSASNRLVSQRDSLRGAIYATTRDYAYAADGGMWERHSVTPSGPDVKQLWQYDNLSRLVGRAEKPSAGAVDTSWNSCRWDGTGRNAQPCHGFQSTFVGPNVVRTSNGWFFVQAPGIDEPLLLIFRNPNTWQMQKRLQAVTDGAGQLIAIADSAGEIDASYAGSGYGQTSWRGAGVMTRGQTFSPRRWETDAQWGEVQQFRNRAYDPGSGRWLQEDPIGVAGGINLYEYNGNDPVTWRDPFGLDPCKSFRQFAAAVCLATEALGDIAARDPRMRGGIVGMEAPTTLGRSAEAMRPMLKGARFSEGFITGNGPAPRNHPAHLPSRIAARSVAGGLLRSVGGLFAGLVVETMMAGEMQSETICKIEKCDPNLDPRRLSAPPRMMGRPD